jgi:uncharacterized tellurite resistance protein B-like protein
MPDYFRPIPASRTRGETEPVFDWPRLLRASDPAHAWSPQEALFCVLFCACVCDGGLERIEQETLLALIHRSRALKALGEEELEDLNGAVSAKLHGREDEALGEACQALPPALRLPLFAQALDIILSDGDLTQKESAFLNRLAAYLHLAEADIRRVAEVISLKNTV